MRLRLVPAVRVSRRPAPARPRPRPPAGGRARRARVGLLVGLVVVIAAQVGMGVAVETTRPEWRDPEYGHRLKQLRSLTAAQPARPLVVAVGSSRTLMGLSPLDMGFPDEPGSPLVYNFGQTGAGPLQILLTVFRLLDAGVKPDFLLIELFPVALAGDGPAEEMMTTWGRRFGAGDVRRLAPYAADPATLWRTWAENRAASCYSLRLTLMNHWRPTWLPAAGRMDYQWDRLDPRGWLAYPRETVSDDVRAAGVARARASYAPAFDDFRIGATSDRALRDVLARCRAEGIPVAFYRMPEGPAFASWYGPRARATVAAYLDRLRHDTGVPVFDAAAGFGEAEFADGHHLLPAGAARFSRKLAGEILNLKCKK